MKWPFVSRAVLDAASREQETVYAYAGRLERRVRELEAQLAAAQDRVVALAQAVVQPAPPPPPGSGSVLPDEETRALRAVEDAWIANVARHLEGQAKLTPEAALAEARRLAAAATAAYG